MNSRQFEGELQKLDPRITIEENPSRPGLSNVKLGGKDICPCPTNEVRDTIDPAYYYVFPNGMQGRHKSKQEIIDSVTKILDLLKTPDGSDLFFGTGDYA